MDQAPGLWQLEAITKIGDAQENYVRSACRPKVSRLGSICQSYPGSIGADFCLMVFRE